MAGVAAAPLNWVAVDLVSGGVIDYLPGLVATSPLATTIGRYESAQVNLPLDSPPANWEAVCNPYTSALIAYDADENPLWGGIVDGRDKNGDSVDLRLVTAEAYFDRRFVGNRGFAAAGQNAIAANLIASFILGGPGLAGRIDGDTGGTARTIAYLDADDKSVYSVLQDLMSDEGGIEWTVGWEWQHAPERLTPVITLGTPTLGGAPAPGEGPNAVFDMPGCVLTAKDSLDYSKDRGANRFRMYGNAAAGRIQSETTATNLLGRPLIESRITPATGDSDTATLGRHARQALAALNDGSSSLSLTASTSSAPRFGKDWFLGDVIGYSLNAPAWPNGLAGTARCIGVQLDPAGAWVSPILAGSL